MVCDFVFINVSHVYVDVKTNVDVNVSRVDLSDSGPFVGASVGTRGA